MTIQDLEKWLRDNRGANFYKTKYTKREKQELLTIINNFIGETKKK